MGSWKKLKKQDAFITTHLAKKKFILNPTSILISGVTVLPSFENNCRFNFSLVQRCDFSITSANIVASQTPTPTVTPTPTLTPTNTPTLTPTPTPGASPTATPTNTPTPTVTPSITPTTTVTPTKTPTPTPSSSPPAVSDPAFLISQISHPTLFTTGFNGFIDAGGGDGFNDAITGDTLISGLGQHGVSYEAQRDVIDFQIVLSKDKTGTTQTVKVYITNSDGSSPTQLFNMGSSSTEQTYTRNGSILYPAIRQDQHLVIVATHLTGDTPPLGVNITGFYEILN